VAAVAAKASPPKTSLAFRRLLLAEKQAIGINNHIEDRYDAQSISKSRVCYNPLKKKGITRQLYSNTRIWLA
jgi:hypothetical protein